MRYADGFDPVLAATFVSSLFGAPGYRAASSGYEWLRKTGLVEF
jgi:hypothetical protein